MPPVLFTNKQMLEAGGAMMSRAGSALYRTSDFRGYDKHTRNMVLAREVISLTGTGVGSLLLQRPYELVRNTAESLVKSGKPTRWAQIFTKNKELMRPLLTMLIPVLISEYASRMLTKFTLDGKTPTSQPHPPKASHSFSDSFKNFFLPRPKQVQASKSDTVLSTIKPLPIHPGKGQNIFAFAGMGHLNKPANLFAQTFLKDRQRTSFTL